MKRRFVYVLTTLLCIVTCVLILKLLQHEPFIRGFVGDLVFMILLYCFGKSCADLRPRVVAGVTLGIAYITEFMQYINLYQYIGMEHNRIARIIFGATFDVGDLIAYTLGVLCIYLLDTSLLNGRFKEY